MGNIVQSINNGVRIDGVQMMLDRISKLEMQLCLLNGGNADVCTPQNLNFELKIVEDMNKYSGETCWKVEKNNGRSWDPWITFNAAGTDCPDSSLPAGLTIYVFDIKQDSVDREQDMRLFSGIITNGQYRVTLMDSYGDGPQFHSRDRMGIANLTITGQTYTLAKWGSKDWDAEGDPKPCIHTCCPCEYMVQAEFSIPYTPPNSTDST